MFCNVGFLWYMPAGQSAGRPGSCAALVQQPVGDKPRLLAHQSFKRLLGLINQPRVGRANNGLHCSGQLSVVGKGHRSALNDLDDEVGHSVAVGTSI
jgi:hypothetical protein